MALAINEALQKKVVDTKLRMDALVNDPLSNFSGSYNGTSKKAPIDATTIVVSSPDTTTQTVGLVKALSGAGVQGRESAVGNEEEMSTLELKLYANSWGNAVSTETYGVDFVRQNAVKVYSQVQPELSRWAGQVMGMKKRQALNELYSYEQLAAPVSRVAGLNINYYAANANSLITRGTLTTFQTNIADTVDAIAAAPSNYTASIDMLNKLSRLAQTAWQIEPMILDGQESYLVILPFIQFEKLFGQNATPSSYTDLAKFDSSAKIINGMSAFKYSNLVIMADPRNSVVSSAAGSAADLTFSYKNAGGAYNTTPLANVASIGYLLGKGALFEMVNEDLHFENEIENYGRDKGIGAFCTKSWTLGQYYTGGDFNPATDYGDTDYASANLRNKSSVVLLFGNS